MVFRDESENVAAKCRSTVEARNAVITTANGHKVNSPISAEAQRARAPPAADDATIPASLDTPLHDVAINFLLADYIRGSHFEYLPLMYSLDADRNLLEPALKAVGLASLALQTARPELQAKSRTLYVEAIASTNLALHSENKALNDSALASILLLSLYETLSPRSFISDTAWVTHIQGALTLLKLRGPAQFRSKFGLDLFKQVAPSIRLFCIQKFIRVPDDLRKLDRLASQHAEDEDIAFVWPRVVEAFADLRADMAEGWLVEASDILYRCNSILQLMQDLTTELPPECRFETISVEKPSRDFHGDVYYRFRDHHVAQKWNTVWQAQLALNSLMCQQIIRLSEGSERPPCGDMNLEAEFMSYEQGIEEAASNICATVPAFFAAEDNSSSNTRRHVAAMGYFLIWPLFTAASTSALVREYIIDRLHFIADDLKLPQARRSAELLEEGARAETWMHIYHIF